MSNSLNKVQLIGNLTADPEIQQTPSGTPVATFSIATNRKWKDSSGEVKEDTEFHPIVAWRGLAELAEQYIKKGKKIYVEGYLKTKTWEDTNGVKKYKTEVVADNIIFLSNAKPGHTDDDAPPV